MSAGWGTPRLEADPVLLERVRTRLARDLAQGDTLEPERVAMALREEGRPVGDATAIAVLDSLRLDIVGAGPLQELLESDGVTDVLVNGPDAVYVERGAGLERTEVRFPDDDAVRRLAQRLAARAGRRLDDAAPYADLRLGDGTRFHAVLAPLARPGTVISLRVPRRRVLRLEELVESGSLPAAGADLLRGLVRRRLAFLVTGGTGSGKTTLLDALLSGIDGPSGWSWWRTPPSCAPTIRTPSPWRPARPTWRARARSTCGPWCARRCGCVPTGSWSARCEATRSSTSWRR